MSLSTYMYCKLGNFRERVIRHICHVKSLQLGHDLPTTVNDRVIPPFLEGFIFKKLRTSEVS